MQLEHILMLMASTPNDSKLAKKLQVAVVTLREYFHYFGCLTNGKRSDQFTTTLSIQLPHTSATSSHGVLLTGRSTMSPFPTLGSPILRTDEACSKFILCRAT